MRPYQIGPSNRATAPAVIIRLCMKPCFRGPSTFEYSEDTLTSQTGKPINIRGQASKQTKIGSFGVYRHHSIDRSHPAAKYGSSVWFGKVIVVIIVEMFGGLENVVGESVGAKIIFEMQKNLENFLTIIANIACIAYNASTSSIQKIFITTKILTRFIIQIARKKRPRESYEIKSAR